MTRLHENKSWLYHQYIVEENSTKVMAKLAMVNSSTIRTWLMKFGIKLRTTSEAMRLFNQKNPGYWGGKNHPNWKGGRIIDDRGYVLIFKPNHPRSHTGRRYVFEHILIAEKALGRKLKKEEVVHHINGDKADNRNCNLLICTASYHRWLESKMSHLYKEEHFGHI